MTVVTRSPMPDDLTPKLFGRSGQQRSSGDCEPCSVTAVGHDFNLQPVSSRKQQGAQDAYHEGMACMWNYELDRAQRILEPWRRTSAWHAGAFAECACLRIALTARRNEAYNALDLVTFAEGLSQSGADTRGGNIMRDLFAAEMQLLRGVLQVLCGAKLRALYNLRQCCIAYRRLEQSTAELARSLHDQDNLLLSNEELLGRINFGVGLFLVTTTWLPVSLCPLARLAGFVIDPQRGKGHLAAVLEGDLSIRAPLAAIILAMYHLDIEPDLERGLQMLVQGYSRWPDCVLLHWASSLVALRNTCLDKAINMTGRALHLCGELGDQAVYLRYELGILHFMSCSWGEAFHHLQYVYESMKSDNICLYYTTIVIVQLAATAFQLNLNDKGEALCRECVPSHDFVTLPVSTPFDGFESSFADVVQTFVKRRQGFYMLAFEVMYFLKLLPRVGSEKLYELRAYVREVGRPYAISLRAVGDDGRVAAVEPGVLVEHASALMLESLILFYLCLAEEEDALGIAQQLSRICCELPSWGTYVAAHGLYWAGRTFKIQGKIEEARSCFRQARAYKKYPFNIAQKVSKVLSSVDDTRDDGQPSTQPWIASMV